MIISRPPFSTAHRSLREVWGFLRLHVERGFFRQDLAARDRKATKQGAVQAPCFADTDELLLLSLQLVGQGVGAVELTQSFDHAG